METISLNKAAIIASLQQHRDVLRQYGVQEIGLFGSFVRDEGKPESDMDFLVNFEPAKKRLRISWALPSFWKKSRSIYAAKP